MEAGDHARLHAWVTGRVQGVGFRFFVLENALPLDLGGWVRNTYDGSVEVVAEGQHANLERLLSLLQQGPRASFVTDVRVEWETPRGEFTSFHVRG
ncbi:MAG: acylphosphatase [Chloroflexi bacterium]|nr:acylphosphatase [Chloroflexota bacterium]